MSLLIVGSVAYDSIRTAKEQRDEILGGSATFGSLVSSRFADSSVVAVVGDDFAEDHLALLENNGVGISGIERVQGGKTFRWSGVYSEDFTERTTLYTQLNVFEQFSPKLADSHRQAEYLFLANIHPQLQLSVLDQIESPKFVAADTMNLWIDTEPVALAEVLKRVDMLLINDEESFMLSGKKNIHEAALKILEMGPNYLVIKRGEFGCAFYGEGKTFVLPAFPIDNVIDPTGAGDSFAGGLMGYLAAGGVIGYSTIRDAIVVGTLVASFTVEDFSVERLISLTDSELELRKDRFLAITA